MNRANALADLGRLNEALAGYDEAIALRRELIAAGRSELVPDLASALMNRGIALESLGRLNEALAGYKEAITLCAQAGEIAAEVHWRALHNAALLVRSTDPVGAAAYAAQAVEIADRLAGSSPSLADRLHHREQVADVFRLAADLHDALGKQADALSFVQRAKGRALSDLLTLRLEAPVATSPIERRIRELRAAEWSLLAQADSGPMEPRPSVREENDRPGPGEGVRTLRIERRALEAQLAAERPARALLVAGAVRPLADLLAVLQPGEAVLETLDLGEEGVLLFVLGGQHPHGPEAAAVAASIVWTGRIDGAALDRALGWWHDALQIRDYDRQRHVRAMTALGDLLAPALAAVHSVGGKRLFISPSGRLFQVPFAALRVPDPSPANEDGTATSRVTLGEIYALSLLPTLTSLWVERQHQRMTWPPSLLAAAPFAPGPDDAPAADGNQTRQLGGTVQEIERAGPSALLPGTAWEVQEVSARVRAALAEDPARVVVLKGPRATRSAILSLAPAAHLLLLATHGAPLKVDGSVLDYHLLFAPGEPDDQPRHLSVMEIYNETLDLGETFQVCLTACHLGDVVRRGEEAMGFGQAFLSAGAGVVLAPIWAVHDAATAALSIAYHAALLSDDHPTVAEAWQHAMATVRNDPDHPEWAHPYYWAAFLPVGDGSLRLGRPAGRPSP